MAGRKKAAGEEFPPLNARDWKRLENFLYDIGMSDPERSRHYYLKLPARLREHPVACMIEVARMANARQRKRLLMAAALRLTGHAEVAQEMCRHFG